MTDRQTHRTTTVTLAAHARRGLIIHMCMYTYVLNPFMYIHVLNQSDYVMDMHVSKMAPTVSYKPELKEVKFTENAIEIRFEG